MKKRCRKVTKVIYYSFFISYYQIAHYSISIRYYMLLLSNKKHQLTDYKYQYSHGYKKAATFKMQLLFITNTYI